MFSMFKVRFAAVACAGLLAIAGAGVARADPVVVEQINIVFTDDFTCDFPMEVTWRGTVRHQIREGREHNVYTTTYTWRNPVNGIEVSGPNHGPDRIVANADGSTTVYATGVLYLAQPHGGRPVPHNAGRAVWLIVPGQPWQLISKSGPDQPLSALCAHMAGP